MRTAASMLTFLLKGFPPLFVILSSASFATPCDRESQPKLASVINRQPFDDGGHFLYESRAEDSKDNLVPFAYYYCIENWFPSNYEIDSVEFKWGTTVEPKAYFSGIVAPGERRPRSMTERRQPTASPQPMSYDAATFSPQTIHPLDAPDVSSAQEQATGSPGDVSGEQEEESTPHEPQLDLSPPPWDSPSHLRNLMEERQATLFHRSYGVVDIPSSEEVASSVKENEYGVFSDGDFAALELEVISSVYPEGDKFYSTTELTYGAYGSEQRKVLNEALNAYEIYLSSEDEALFADAETDDEGRYRVRPLSDGAVKLLLTKNLTDHISEKQVALKMVDNENYAFGELRINYFVAE